MKKTIIIEILLLIVLAWLIYDLVIWYRTAHDWIAEWKYIEANYNPDNFATFDNTLAGIKKSAAVNITRAIIATLSALSTLAAMVIIAIKDFPVFKPLVDKFNAKRAARKEQRAAVKAEQAEADKQARIEQLQAELDELKKDE